MKLVKAIALLLATALVAAAGNATDEQSPSTPAAKGALAKLVGEKQAAQREYDKTVAKATAVAVERLEAIKRETMKQAGSGALEEANRLQRVINELRGSKPAFVERASPAGGYRFRGPRNTFDFKLLPSGEIAGAQRVLGNAASWSVHKDERLVFSANQQDAAHLVELEPGVFVGRWLNNGDPILIERVDK